LHAPPNITWHGCRPGGGRRRRALLEEGNNNEEKMTVRSSPEEHRRKLLYMMNDRPISVAPYISELLNGGIPVLVYNGDRDMTTNMVGSELVLNQMMEWDNIDKWLDAPRGLWKDRGSYSKHPEAGWAKEYGNLSYVVVYNSGHMVRIIRAAVSRICNIFCSTYSLQRSIIFSGPVQCPFFCVGLGQALLTSRVIHRRGIAADSLQ